MTVCGTPDYVAPEVVLRKGHDRGVDVWAVGILIYEMMCGKAPFQTDAQDPARIYTRILNKEPKFTSSHWKGAGWEVVDLIQCLLKKNPKDRLGNGKRGMQEIRAHPWFKKISWSKLERKQLPAYYAIRVDNPLDASNFEPIADDSMLDGAVCNDDCFNFLIQEPVPDIADKNGGSPERHERRRTAGERKSVTFEGVGGRASRSGSVGRSNGSHAGGT